MRVARSTSLNSAQEVTAAAAQPRGVPHPLHPAPPVDPHASRLLLLAVFPDLDGEDVQAVLDSETVRAARYVRYIRYVRRMDRIRR